MTEISIPLVNLHRQFLEVKDEIERGIAAVLASQKFIKGPAVRSFETAWLAAIGARHGSGCSNGTAALSIALEALGIGPGDEVVTSAHTFFATGEAIRHVGATPVFADIERASYTLDPTAVEAAITPRTRAILPVHIYGAAADMDTLSAIAARHGLKVVEDAAQAHLATLNGRFLGALGDAGCFSFYPGKNLGAYGDAGFIVVRDATVVDRVSRLIDHGRRSKYVHDIVGYNHRMDDLQAAVLEAKLAHLPAWTTRRRSLAALYDERLKAHGFKVLEPRAGSLPAYHLYVVETSNREDAMEAMRRQGIDTGVHYPVPLHRQPAFDGLGYGTGSLPVTETAADRVMSLPLCGSLTEDEAHRVCDAFLGTARP
ncbi:DegT/DnrJ/EryC1/StrS family aminotransferase [Azospirillum tabaci]|uniref:DegT/DnrJ/EryC1/StrS family aminotransferase n=1 Tax=Azospirillum tabaci TaxID=2752310 RepID=UPI001660E4C4|nr:DegT/DnrJ/EryC1/StrS family aminotransferase [Azospirillum tabaci]